MSTRDRWEAVCLCGIAGVICPATATSLTVSMILCKRKTMNMSRRMLLLSAVPAFVALSGCVTSRLHEDRQYVETFDSILITSDHKQIVVVSRDHHYIFQAPPELLALIGSDLRPDLSAEFRRFVVEADGSISGSLDLSLKAVGRSYTTEQIYKAELLGMSRTAGGGMHLSVALTGKRFSASRSVAEKIETQKLNRSYSVPIVERPSVAELGVRAALTPITVAADGVLLLAAIPLLPIFAIGSGHVCGALQNGGRKDLQDC